MVVCNLTILVKKIETILTNENIIKRRYQIHCTRHVSGITFISYGHDQKIGKPNKLKSLEASNPTGPTQEADKVTFA